MLTELRQGVATSLEAAGVKSVEYTTETLRPPVAAVVPGEPYLSWGTSDTPFATPMTIHLDVLLLIAQVGSGKKEAARIDQMVEKAVAALSGHRISRVTQPGVLRLDQRGQKVEFVGAVIQIQQDTPEPEAP